MTKGFALIEIIMGTFLVMFLILGATLFLSGMWSSFLEFKNKEEGLVRARLALHTMARELREARNGEDGSFFIEKATPTEIVFFSDIDGDSKTEKVRYFLGRSDLQEKVQSCTVSSKGGSCSLIFSDLPDNIKEARLEVKVKGDLGASWEYLLPSLNGTPLERICSSGCTDCPKVYQGNKVFNPLPSIRERSLTLSLSATSYVDPICVENSQRYAFTAQASLLYTMESSLPPSLHKGVTKPNPENPIYDPSSEKITLLLPTVENQDKIFSFYDETGKEILNPQERIKDIKSIKITLRLNLDPKRPESEVFLEKIVRLRNR